MSWIVLALLACGPQRLPTAVIQVGPHPVTVEIASTPKARADGLMHREDLESQHGMLFIFPDSRTRGFWMKNTRIPLSIAYVNSELEIVRIADMVPFSTDRVPSLYPAKYALEMKKGWFKTHEVERGAKLSEMPDIIPE